MAADKYFYALGRRKTSSATVRLFEQAGDSTINGEPVEKRFPNVAEKARLLEPFVVASIDPKTVRFDAKVNGGGWSSQLDAIRHAISRSLVVMNPELKKDLSRAGLLTRDPRMVERKKPGLHKARKAEQYSKR